jgi:pimeloyl-ACP methyl ester carboxylesterase
MKPVLQAIVAGHGPTMLLLHGIGTSATLWQRVIDRLAGDFRLVAPDLRGYGDSPDPAGATSLDAVVADVCGLIEPGTAPVHAVGVSFGALTALALARARPELVRSLVLADATLGRATLPADERARWVEMRYALADDLEGVSMERARAVTGADPDPDTLAELAAGMRRARRSGYRNVTDIIAATDALPWLPEVRHPTLVMCGTEDRIVGLPLSQLMAERIPGARLVTFEGAGHAPHVEQPDAFAREVRAFAGAN